MQLLYSNVPPLKLPLNALTISDYLHSNAECADELICAVGYASKRSLIELDKIVREKKIQHTVLILGMYCIEGFPESIYNTAMEINKRWKEEGIGEIRAVKSMKYHGKVYGFYSSGRLFSASIGSHNLGALASDAGNLRQYELSIAVEGKDECGEIDAHLKQLICKPVSFPLDKIDNVLIIHEENTKLNGVEGATKVTQADVDAYKASQTGITFNIKLKVPGDPSDTRDYMKSNINKCYAKGRLNSRSGVVTERGWWETEIIVSSVITLRADYPEADVPFFVITDDGWKFLVHVSGTNKKNFESHGDLKILGYWLKGRLVAAGIVDPVDSPAADLLNTDNTLKDIYRKCRGVITYSKLQNYGRTSVSFTKTANTLLDDEGVMRDVWMLSFLPNSVK